MKQGIWLVILQLVSILLGFITVFYVASGIGPEVYSIVGIYTVISVFFVALTVLGIETAAIRNILYWQQTKRLVRIKRHISTAICSRLLMYVILLPVAIGYSYYISESKFGGENLELFLLFCFVSFFSVINVSFRLALVGFNKYLLAAIPDFSVNILGRLIALYVFTAYGFEAFIMVLISLPIVTTFFLLLIIRNWLELKYIFSFKSLKILFKKNKALAGANVVQYGFNSVDQLLVSLFVSPELFATFSLAKQVELIGKKFIENIFDPIVQQLVKLKGDVNGFNSMKGKITKFHSICCFFSIGCCFFIVWVVDYGVTYLSIEKYPFVNTYFYFALISNVLYLFIKLNYNLVALFSPVKQVLLLEIFRTVTFVFIFLMFLNFINQEYLYLYRSLAFVALYIYLRNILKHERKKNIDSDV
jgi:O-antigen/teichoic acid export membrane protein